MLLATNDGLLSYEISGFTASKCPGAAEGMRVYCAREEVGVVREAESDFVSVNFTTNSRSTHRKLSAMVAAQTVNPRVRRGVLVIG